MESKPVVCRLDFSYTGMIPIYLKGLKIKGIAFLYRCDLRCIAIDVQRWNIDGKTAKPKLEFVVDALKEVYSSARFDAIKIKGHYPFATADELLKLVKEK